MGPAHSQTIEATVAQLDTDSDVGLSPAEAERRLAADGRNELGRVEPTPWFSRFSAQLSEPLSLLLGAAAAISILLWLVEDGSGVPIDAVTITAIVVLNAALAATQERQADRSVDALRELSAPTARLIRGGRPAEVPAAEIVRGDLLLLTEGEQVPADGRLVDASDLRVSEAALTGESEAVAKDLGPVSADAPVADRICMVHSGTAVVQGHGTVVVTGTGHSSEVGKIASLIAEAETRATPLEAELERLGTVLGRLVLVIGGVVVLLALASGDGLGSEAVLSAIVLGVAVAVAAIPEGLPAMLSLVLAIGVRRLADRNALVKRLASAETLGSATVICTDKTGTLTLNQMTVTDLRPADGVSVAELLMGAALACHLDRRDPVSDASGLAADSGVVMDGSSDRSGLAVEVEAGMTGSDDRGMISGRSVDSADRSEIVASDPTEAALIAAALADPSVAERLPAWTTRAELAFTSDRKLMSVLAEHDRGQVTLFTKGAPEVVLALSTHEADGAGGLRPLTDDARSRWSAEVDELARQATRALAVAASPRSDTEGVIVEEGLAFLGVVGLKDPPRPTARGAVESAQTAGVRVLMVTGDHPATAVAIGSETGVCDAGARAVTGQEIAAMSAGELAATASEVSVFARVDPSHKLDLVHALQAQGEVVAMTGDGVNDGPALKAADIGTAMGASGTDVAREAADMVLVDDDISTLTTAIATGRGMIGAIRAFLRYLLTSNAGEVLTITAGVVLAGVIGLNEGGELIVPLTATQILWINLLTDSAPALALGAEPADEEAMRRPPRALDAKIVDRAMLSQVAFIGAVMAACTLGMLDLMLPGGLIEGDADVATGRTAAFNVLVLSQLFNAFSARSATRSAFVRAATNRWLLAAVIFALALQVAVLHLAPLASAFGTVPLTWGEWVASAGMASVVLWATELRKVVLRRRQAP